MAGRVLPIRRAAPPRPPQQPAPPAAPPPLRTTWSTLAWRTGDKVRWHGYSGTFLRETVDDQAEVLIGTRTLRLPKAELRPTGQQ